MSKMIQLRNVPEDLHRLLKVRAAAAGMSLSDYLLTEIREIADKPSLGEWLERTEGMRPAKLSEEPWLTIRRHRDG